MSFLKKLRGQKTGESVQSEGSTGTWDTNSTTSNSPSGLGRFTSFRSSRSRNSNNPFSDGNAVSSSLQPSPAVTFPVGPGAPYVATSQSIPRGSVYGYPSSPQSTSYQPGNTYSDPSQTQGDTKSASGPSGPSGGYDEPPPIYQEKPVVASSSRAPPEPEPAPRPIQRAGTFDAAKGGFRNLNIERMTKDEILDLFGAISGANILSEVDTIFVIDNSESMATYGFWLLVRICLSLLAPIIGAFDPDGYSAYVLNRGSKEPDDYARGIVGGGWNNLSTFGQIQEIFDSIHARGSTPTDIVLQKIIKFYLTRLENDPDSPLRPLNIVVITDGSADDPDGVKDLIKWTCSELDRLEQPPNQIGIQFVQIGNIAMATQHIRTVHHNDPRTADNLIRKATREIAAATQFLQDIDDFMGALATDARFQNSRDIVDTKNADLILQEGGFNPVVLVQILCGALIKRFDNNPIKQR